MALKQLSPLMLINFGLGLVCITFITLIVLTLTRTQEAVTVANQNSVQATQQQNWRWFSQASNEVAANEENFDEQYEEINIQAELVGVVITPDISVASIRLGRDENIFHVGDELQPGIEVTGIKVRRVVLTQRGRAVQLSFPELDTSSRRVSVGQTNNQTRENSLQGFEIPDMFAAVPVDVSGHNGGLRMGGISQNMRDLVDIRDDDVVVQLGSSSVQDVLSNPALMINLGTETALPITIIRDGEERVIYVNALSLSARLLPQIRQE